MTDEEVEAAISAAHRWARFWLVDQPSKEEGHVLRRQVVMHEALSEPPPLPSPDEIDWQNLPIRFDRFKEDAVYDDAKGKVLSERAARGDADADAALCATGMKYIYFGMAMPPNLRGYISAILMRRFNERGPRRPGADPYANIGRNMYIVGAVARLECFGFRPTRSRARKDGAKESGCSIVTKALAKIGIPITEDGVEEVWGNRKSLGLGF